MKASVSELARGSGECLEFAGSQKLVAHGDGHPFARCGHECDFAGSELEGLHVSEILRDAGHALNVIHHGGFGCGEFERGGDAFTSDGDFDLLV